jgi:hypothetical protein
MIKVYRWSYHFEFIKYFTKIHEESTKLHREKPNQKRTLNFVVLRVFFVDLRVIKKHN